MNATLSGTRKALLAVMGDHTRLIAKIQSRLERMIADHQMARSVFLDTFVREELWALTMSDNIGHTRVMAYHAERVKLRCQAKDFEGDMIDALLLEIEAIKDGSAHEGLSGYNTMAPVILKQASVDFIQEFTPQALIKD
ncbi:MAG: hypothetical protein P8Y64_07730 [Gammaproteobacteria bacterium]|jgi:hypothetical protein